MPIRSMVIAGLRQEDGYCSELKRQIEQNGGFQI